eukprot:CAMPEP_0170600114 /NCGR_PEP_ID=MMETSP0224-20130122/17165_1 /TAXON_ID=285029 /ORGANISM="Togula jolla, Strain CCCM 725" /LENGTH=277 /DNA_ID=CAMNT_0010924825 /DNA_START=167 /DNA_END=997 /DNA_ORIENTATION=-
MILAAWCPWAGVRGGDASLYQQFLVLSGASLALGLRTMFVEKLTPQAEISDWAAFSLMFVLAVRAYIDLGRADGVMQTPDAEAGAEGEAISEHKGSETWNKSAFSGMPSTKSDAGFAAEESMKYGSFAPVSADGLLAERNDRLISDVIAFVGTVFLVFAAEADDKSEAALLDQPLKGAVDVTASVIGSMLAVFIAVFIGFVVERQLSNARVLFLAAAVLFPMSLMTLSQALLHLGALEGKSASDTVVGLKASSPLPSEDFATEPLHLCIQRLNSNAS